MRDVLRCLISRFSRVSHWQVGSRFALVGILRYKVYSAIFNRVVVQVVSRARRTGIFPARPLFRTLPHSDLRNYPVFFKMIVTELTKKLGIRVPVVQGGMQWVRLSASACALSIDLPQVGLPSLAAAVSNAGGLVCN